MTQVSLLADIGGTHARFGLLMPDNSVTHVHVLRGAEHAGLPEAFAHYRTLIPADLNVTRAALAVAGPVIADEVLITNRGWSFSQQAVRHDWSLDELHVVNDFTAIALALPHLSDTDTLTLQTGLARANWPLCVLGPGTGLGVSGLMPLGDGRWRPLAGEGGHVSLPVATEREAAILAILQKQFGYVSAEHVLSGRGLVNLYGAMAQLNNQSNPYTRPDDIRAAALEQQEPLALDVIRQFCAFLGLAAGNAALTMGALGGVFIAGGILPRMPELLKASDFITRFQTRGVVADYLQDVPIRLITTPIPAFLGLRTLLTH